MAVTTTEYTLEPGDGWTEIANAASTFLLVGLETNGPWLFAAQASAPTSATGGILMSGSFMAASGVGDSTFIRAVDDNKPTVFRVIAAV